MNWYDWALIGSAYWRPWQLGLERYAMGTTTGTMAPPRPHDEGRRGT